MKTKAVFKSRLDYFIFISLVIYFILTVTLPFFNQATNAKLSMLVIVFLLLLIIYSNPNRYIKYLIPFLLLILLEVMFRAVYSINTIPLFLYGRLIWLLPALISYFVIYNNRINISKIILNAGVIGLFVTSLTSSFWLLNDPLAARILATIGDSKNYNLVELNMNNVGGFNIVYIVVTIFPMIIALRKERVMKMPPFLIISVSFALYIYMSQYAIALILFVFGGVSYFTIIKKFNRKYILFVILIISSILIFKSSISYMIYNIANRLESIILSERLVYISDLLANKDVSSNEIDGRFNLIGSALKTFIRNPIFGTFMNNTNSGISGHSFILDNLAKFGILGFAGIYLLYFQIYKYFFRPYRNQNFFIYMLYSFFISIVLGLFNPIDSLFAIAFIVPLAGFFIVGKKYRAY